MLHEFSLWISTIPLNTHFLPKWNSSQLARFCTRLLLDYYSNCSVHIESFHSHLSFIHSETQDMCFCYWIYASIRAYLNPTPASRTRSLIQSVAVSLRTLSLSLRSEIIYSSTHLVIYSAKYYIVHLLCVQL